MNDFETFINNIHERVNIALVDSATSIQQPAPEHHEENAATNTSLMDEINEAFGDEPVWDSVEYNQQATADDLSEDYSGTPVGDAISAVHEEISQSEPIMEESGTTEQDDLMSSIEEAFSEAESNIREAAAEQIGQMEQVEQVESITSEVVNNDQNYSSTARFSSADWFSKVANFDISIFGCGGIGSWTSMAVSRLRPRYIRLFDDDFVDSLNMAGQLYRRDIIGMPKVTAMLNTITAYSSYYNVLIYKARVDAYTSCSNVTIGCFDNMDARKAAFNAWMKQAEEDWLFIDGRLLAEKFQVIAFTAKDTAYVEDYSQNWLFDDSQAREGVCSYKQTTFCAMMIASIISNIIVNHACILCGDDTRVLPFLTEYSADDMFLKTQF